MERPFAKGHGNAQSAGSVQDPALRLKKLTAHLRVVDYLEEHAGMTVEDIKAERDEADPQLARLDIPMDDVYAHAHTCMSVYCMCIPHVMYKCTAGNGDATR
mgnify:FL=1